MWWDADIDALMTRTRKRPIPDGRIRPEEALSFGMTLAVGSVLALGLIANWLAAAFLAFTIFFYVVVYSIGLKRWTAQNIVIGGAAGAFPPMIGEAAVSGTVSLETFILFAIIFLWTPPHFWALALVKSADYARAGIPMLPNVAGAAATRRQILLYTLVLAPVGVVPVAAGFAGLAYAVVSVLGGLAMLALALQVFRIRDGRAGDAGGAAALRLLDPVPVPALRRSPRRAWARAPAPARIAGVSADERRPRPLSPEAAKRRRSRSIAIALALAALALLFYVVTIAKMGPQVLNRPL